MLEDCRRERAREREGEGCKNRALAREPRRDRDLGATER